MAAKTDGTARLKVTQVKSTISHIARNRATVKALGLRGIGSTSVVTDNDATRGMVRQVRFLVSVEEIPGAGTKPARDRADESDKARRSDDAVEETT
jgi:large subunit ribosomal protein L30